MFRQGDLVLARGVNQRVQNSKLHRRDVKRKGFFHKKRHCDLLRTPDQVARGNLEFVAFCHETSLIVKLRF